MKRAFSRCSLNMSKKISSSLVVLCFMASSQAFSSENKNLLSESQKTIRLQLENDNPFLNLMPDLFYVDDDHGYSHGLGFDFELIPKNPVFSKGERWNVNLKSELYSKSLVPGDKTEDDYFPNVPQQFNEVTHLRGSWDNILDSQDRGKVYYLVGAGIGKVNDSDESGWAAAGQQRRWHDYKHNELTPETTPTYDNKLGSINKTFISAKLAAGKIIRFDNSMVDCQCEINRVKIESGAEFISIRKGSRAYVFVGVDKTVFKFGANNSIGASFDNTASIYQNGDRQLKTFGGVYFKSKSWKIKTGFTKINGDQNKEFYINTDDDSIWMLSVEKKF